MSRQLTPHSAKLSHLLSATPVLAVLLAASSIAAAQAVTFISSTSFSNSNVVLDSAGNLYGTAQLGGTSQTCNSGCGYVYQLSPTTSGGWTQTTIYNFSGSSDGGWPSAGLVIDSKGRLFGTTTRGGDSTCNCGNVFLLAPTSTGWTQTSIHNFTGPDGEIPATNLIFDSHGNLFGGTTIGGAFSYGNIFMLAPTSSGWKESIVLNFTKHTTGSGPSSFAFDAAGNLYASLLSSGSTTSYCGGLIQLSRTSSGWKESKLHIFTGKGLDGCYPNSLHFDSTGHLYGVTALGGTSNQGTVFRLTNASGVWKESTLYSFTGGNDGGQPDAIAFAPNGQLFGITNFGVPNGCVSFDGCSQVFKLAPGSTGWSVTATYPTPNGFPSNAGLTFDPTGNLYGTVSDDHYEMYSDVFELAP